MTKDVAARSPRPASGERVPDPGLDPGEGGRGAACFGKCPLPARCSRARHPLPLRGRGETERHSQALCDSPALWGRDSRDDDLAFPRRLFRCANASFNEPADRFRREGRSVCLRRQSSIRRRNDGDTRIWKRSVCSSSGMGLNPARPVLIADVSLDASYLPRTFRAAFPRPISTSRRSASEREGLSGCCLAQASIAAMVPKGMRNANCGS
jgi:hypothetical protein